jgi:hypothetical protein
MPIAFSKDTQTVIERGQAAWQRLLSQEQETWSDWLAIGEAIKEASTAMMRALGLNRPEGKRWADNFGEWLRETGFYKIDKAVRSRLKKCMEHRVEIEEWRASLPVEKRVNYNHPTTVLRNWSAAFGVSAAVKKGPTKVEQLTAANLELQDNLDKALAEVTRLGRLAEARRLSRRKRSELRLDIRTAEGRAQDALGLYCQGTHSGAVDPFAGAGFALCVRGLSARVGERDSQVRS